ncbi:MAG: hypothetical protein ACOZQL_24150 [Myxococcota bacterium]
MRSLLLLPLLCLACGQATTSPDGGSIPDGGMTPDASVGAWVGRIQPLLWAHCADCHSPDGGGVATYGAQVPFMESHAKMLMPSTKCPGESLGVCVSRAVNLQVVEGTRCRTVETPFHREGWPCLTAAEVTEVSDWVDAGMPER